VADVIVPLLDLAGQWTHRDRHQHHRIELDVPDGTVELTVRFRWGPQGMGSEHESNGVNLSLFAPDGYRGGAMRGRPDHTITIGETTASLGCEAGPIAPGVWTLNVDTGEILNDGEDTGFLTYRLEATARIGEPAQARPADPPAAAPSLARGPSPAAPGWYRGDLHSHTTHSDGDITVEDRVRGAVARGQDFLAITDHNTVSHHREVDRWPDGITPIRGSEVTTFHGHMNCFGLATAIDWRDDARGSGARSIVEQAHRQGALISINHPSAFGDPWCGGCHWDYALVDYSTFDAMEVWNGRWKAGESDNNGALDFWTDLLDAGFRLTAVSGTDSHSAEEDDYPALPMNHVHADECTEPAILEGIRRGRVILSSGPFVRFRARVSDGREIVLPGEEMPADGGLDLTVDVDRLEGPATLWFVTSGSRVALGSCEPGTARLSRAGLVATGWWRLELRGGAAANADPLALTNPVYLTG
jgi:hypothetical protein